MEDGLYDAALEEVRSRWNEIAPGRSVNMNGLRNLRHLLRQFTKDEVLSAMIHAADQYLRWVGDTPTAESWELAFERVGGICRVAREEQEDPGVRELYLIRGIARSRIRGPYFDDLNALIYLRYARDDGVPLKELKFLACRVSYWHQFVSGICDLRREWGGPQQEEV